jgi:hypothetical protein
MTEIRDAQHFEIQQSEVARLIEQAREELIAKQLEMYPDSRIMTDAEVLREWVYAVPKQLSDKWEEWTNTHMEDWASYNLDTAMTNLLRERKYSSYRNAYLEMVARSVAVAMSNSSIRVFYECVKREDGTYKFRGCRDGLRGQDYASSFGYF